MGNVTLDSIDPKSDYLSNDSREIQLIHDFLRTVSSQITALSEKLDSKYQTSIPISGF